MLARQGDNWAVNRLLNQPQLTQEEEEYFDLFHQLLEDREHLVFPIGMSGSLMLRQISSRTRIRSIGRHAGFTGEDLEDFVAIIRRIENDDFDADFKYQMDRAIKAAEAAARRSRFR